MPSGLVIALHARHICASAGIKLLQLGQVIMPAGTPAFAAAAAPAGGGSSCLSGAFAQPGFAQPAFVVQHVAWCSRSHAAHSETSSPKLSGTWHQPHGLPSIFLLAFSVRAASMSIPFRAQAGLRF